MKRLIIAAVVFFIPSILAFSQSEINYKRYLNADLGYDTFDIGESFIHYKNLTGIGTGGINGIYMYPDTIELAGHQEIFESGAVYWESSDIQQQFLILQTDDVVISYCKDTNWDTKRVFFVGISEYSQIHRIFFTSRKPEQSTASSYLTEKNTRYEPQNIQYARLDLPWVEGAEGAGIGEYIEFELQSDYGEKQADGFILLNGFISWDKPYLYNQNGRVKKATCVDLDTNKSWTINLADTGIPQIFPCPESKGHRIRLIIDEVYPGSKYDDTCITGIMLYN